MKKRAIWAALTGIMVISLLLSSCGTSTTKTTTTSAPVSTTSTNTPSTTHLTSTTTTTKTTLTTTTSTTSTTGHWWDSMGTPQYGGTMNIRLAGDITNWDPYTSGGAARIESAFMERLGTDDWSIDPAVFNYKLTWRPPDYLVGQLAESWEFTDTNTMVFHIRHGIPWQNIAPANGREFVATDVVSHWNRIYGLNGVKGSPFYTPTAYQTLTSLTAPDKYTVVFKWSTSNPEVIMETLLAISNELLIENPEAAAQWGNLQDWHHAIGTGPFIVTDFVSSSSATLVANPNYWKNDEHYPGNKLPYIRNLNFLIIANNATALAAMRAGKLDTCGAPTITDANGMKQTNPEILQIVNPNNASCTVDMRNDKPPFTDIRVRQAMQLAMNLPLLASSYYGGATSPLPLELTCYTETGWAWPYDQWPQELKDQYTFNVAKAKKLLADANLANGFKTNVVVDTGADQDLLLVVQSFLADINVTMDIRKMDPTAWVAYVQNGKLHDQMSMRSGGSLAFQYEPARQLQRFQTGYSVNFPQVSDPVYDAFYPAFVAANSITQMKGILRDANERVLRQHYVISLTESVSFNLTQPWLKGFNGQNYSVLYGYYLSRFWIDQKMKSSMGH